MATDKAASQQGGKNGGTVEALEKRMKWQVQDMRKSLKGIRMSLDAAIEEQRELEAQVRRMQEKQAADFVYSVHGKGR